MKPTLQHVLLMDLDKRLPALTAVRRSAARPSGGWLRAVRQALGLAQAAVAKNAGTTQQGYAQFERGEVGGTITLTNLQRAAEAMDCALVYFLVPHSTRSNSFTGLAAQLDPDFIHLQASEHSMALEDQAVGDLPAPKPPAKK
jgi:predicted DNA-binding mobile mystery protein A